MPAAGPATYTQSSCYPGFPRGINPDNRFGYPWKVSFRTEGQDSMDTQQAAWLLEGMNRAAGFQEFADAGSTPANIIIHAHGYKRFIAKDTWKYWINIRVTGPTEFVSGPGVTVNFIQWFNFSTVESDSVTEFISPGTGLDALDDAATKLTTYFNKGWICP